MEGKSPAAEHEGETAVVSSEEVEIPPADDEHGEIDSSTLSAVDRQYAAQPELPRRIHILGTGNIGKLVAHSLRGIPNPPPITLILHRYKLLQAWEGGKQQITLQDDEVKVARGGIDVELQEEVRRQHGIERTRTEPGPYDFGEDVQPHQVAKAIEEHRGDQDAPIPAKSEDSPRRHIHGGYAVSDEPIHNLIVTVKAAATVPALRTLKDRLLPTSTICFLQNGLGILDDVNKHVFPDEESRPNYVQGIVTHGVNVPPAVAARDPFFVVHAGHGTIALGKLPKSGGPAATESHQPEAPSARYLMRTLTRTPVLCAVGFTPLELFQQQLEKLAVNSVLNPLTSLFDARNGNLLYNFALTRTMRLMLAETSLVIRSLPELRNVPNVNVRFSAKRLEAMCVSVAKKTSDNISSMLADVRAGRKTEIDYINGYIVRRGDELGISCVVNYAIMQTVIGKAAIIGREVDDDVPIEGRVDLNKGA